MSTRKIRLMENKRLHPGTEKADLFLDPVERRKIWIPRTVVHHVSRDPVDVHGFSSCVVEVDEWFADKEEL